MTLSEIRDSLTKLASLKNRPPYDLCVAKSVRDAFADGTHNILKEELICLLRIQLQEKKDESEVFLSQAQKRMPAKRDDVRALIKWVSMEIGRAERLADAAGLDSSLISAMRKNGRCTIDLYNRLMKGKAKMMLGGVASMRRVDALDQFKKSGMSYNNMMQNCQIYAAGIRTEETLLAKNIYGNLRRHGLLEEVRPEVKAVEPLVDGIPYSKILKLRKEYVQGLRNEDTKHANAIYQRMLRRGWHTGLRLRCNAITKRDGEQ